VVGSAAAAVAADACCCRAAYVDDDVLTDGGGDGCGYQVGSVLVVVDADDAAVGLSEVAVVAAAARHDCADVALLLSWTLSPRCPVAVYHVLQ